MNRLFDYAGSQLRLDAVPIGGADGLELAHMRLQAAYDLIHGILEIKHAAGVESQGQVVLPRNIGQKAA